MHHLRYLKESLWSDQLEALLDGNLFMTMHGGLVEKRKVQGGFRCFKVCDTKTAVTTPFNVGQRGLGWVRRRSVQHPREGPMARVVVVDLVPDFGGDGCLPTVWRMSKHQRFEQVLGMGRDFFCCFFYSKYADAMTDHIWSQILYRQLPILIFDLILIEANGPRAVGGFSTCFWHRGLERANLAAAESQDRQVQLPTNLHSSLPWGRLSLWRNDEMIGSSKWNIQTNVKAKISTLWKLHKTYQNACYIVQWPGLCGEPAGGVPLSPDQLWGGRPGRSG